MITWSRVAPRSLFIGGINSRQIRLTFDCFSITLFILLSLLQAIPATAADSIREQEYADLLQTNLPLGKIIRLKAGDRIFLGIYTHTEKTGPGNAAIILHDISSYPDQKPVVHELRTQLPRHNWATLALQMPVRETSASEADYYPLFPESHTRVRAAIEYLQSIGVTNIAVIGYGLGALMSVFSVNENAKDLAALVTISLATPDSTVSQAQTETFIKNIALPFFDIYAEFDIPAVTNTADRRKLAGRDNPVYRQKMMDGEDHAFKQENELLVKWVYSWLTSTIQTE